MGIQVTDIQTFVNAAARDALLPAPLRGQGCYLMSTGEFLIYIDTYFGWRPPWNSSWGIVSSVEMPTFVQAAAGDLIGVDLLLNQSFTPVLGRRYEFVLSVNFADFGPVAPMLLVLKVNSYNDLGAATFSDTKYLGYPDGGAYRQLVARRRYKEGTAPFNAGHVTYLGAKAAYFNNRQADGLSTTVFDGFYGADSSAFGALTVYDIGPLVSALPAH